PCCRARCPPQAERLKKRKGPDLWLTASAGWQRDETFAHGRGVRPSAMAPHQMRPRIALLVLGTGLFLMTGLVALRPKHGVDPALTRENQTAGTSEASL